MCPFILRTSTRFCELFVVGIVDVGIMLSAGGAVELAPIGVAGVLGAALETAVGSGFAVVVAAGVALVLPLLLVVVGDESAVGVGAEPSGVSVEFVEVGTACGGGLVLGTGVVAADTGASEVSNPSALSVTFAGSVDFGITADGPGSAVLGRSVGFEAICVMRAATLSASAFLFCLR